MNDAPPAAPEPLDLPVEDLPPRPAAPPAPPPRPAKPYPTPARLLANLAVLLLSGFILFRVGIAEPFGVPTGSMAPTLIGNHRQAACTRCGCPVRVGMPSGGERAGHYADIPCPNCGQKASLAAAPGVSGDRVMVDKLVYQFRRPRRWEVAVFRCAADQYKAYVKRILGLPGEEITIVDGEVYAGGELLRKAIAEVRETQLPVFDLSFAPPGGWGPRWYVYPPERDARLPPGDAPPPAPAGPAVLHDGQLVLDAAASPQAEVRLEYRHVNLDARDADGEPVRSGTGYDGGNRSTSNIYPVHDFSVRCEVEVVEAGPGATLAFRLYDGADAVAAEVSVGPRADGKASLSHDKQGGLAAAGGVALEPGRSYAVEFAFVDRRATFAVDRRVVVPPVDLPAVKKRGEVRRPLQLGARGCRVVVRRLQLFRDIHYTQAGRHGTRSPARLGPDEYFMLGDNSGNSQDSREWPSPGVPEGDFLGKPILVHQPLRPGRVTIAGRERTFQTLDWGRLRWLH
jgi:signal peptidase I